jgi:hypothetical protein
MATPNAKIKRNGTANTTYLTVAATDFQYRRSSLNIRLKLSNPMKSPEFANTLKSVNDRIRDTTSGINVKRKNIINQGEINK